jgi:hypothetical protein
MENGNFNCRYRKKIIVVDHSNGRIIHDKKDGYIGSSIWLVTL